MYLAAFKKIDVLITFVIAAGCVPALAKSSLTSAGTINFASQNNGGSIDYKISVHPGIAGYYGIYDGDGVPPGEVASNPFNYPVTAYRFWNVTKANTIGTLTQSGQIIGDLQTKDTQLRGESTLKLWESTDSNGSSFSTAADHTTQTSVHDISDASGSIDISKMSRGSIYFIYGAYRSTPKFTVSMGGSSTAKDVNLENIHNGDQANNTEYYLAQIDFVNEDGYKKVEWSMPAGGNYRFSGIVVTAPDNGKNSGAE